MEPLAISVVLAVAGVAVMAADAKRSDIVARRYGTCNRRTIELAAVHSAVPRWLHVALRLAPAALATLVALAATMILV